MAHEHDSSVLKQKEAVVKTSLSIMQSLTEEMGRLFKLPCSFENATDEAGPRVRVVMRPNKLIFRAKLLGMHKEDLKVQIDDRLLIIQAQPLGNGKDLDEELSVKGFCRCLELPEKVNCHDAHATFREGVLEVTLPLE